LSFSYPPTGGNNNIFATLPSGSVGVATLKIKREQIEKGDLATPTNPQGKEANNRKRGKWFEEMEYPVILI
jgi:hypothetical protein